MTLLKYITPTLASLPLFFGSFDAYKEEIEVNEIVEEEEEEVVSYIEVEATFYTAFCDTGCIGITKLGHDVRNTIYVDGLRVIAVDSSKIKLGSIVNVVLDDGEQFNAIASDTGGDIKGNRIDVLVQTTKQAYEKGRQKAKLTILED